jgi:hypothetical protein
MMMMMMMMKAEEEEGLAYKSVIEGTESLGVAF